jgi:hypothetical protein
VTAFAEPFVGLLIVRSTSMASRASPLPVAAWDLDVVAEQWAPCGGCVCAMFWKISRVIADEIVHCLAVAHFDVSFEEYWGCEVV